MPPSFQSFDSAVTLPASKVVATSDPLQVHERGRRCGHPDCDTRLSRYNPDALCTAHGGWSDATVKRPGRKPAAPHPVAAPSGAGAAAGHRRPSGSQRPAQHLVRGAGPSSVEIVLPDDDDAAPVDDPPSPAGRDGATVVIAEIELQQADDRLQMEPLLQRVGNLLASSNLEVDLHSRGAVVRGGMSDIMDCVQRIHELSSRHVEDVQTNVRVIAPARGRPATL